MHEEHHEPLRAVEPDRAQRGVQRCGDDRELGVWLELRAGHCRGRHIACKPSDGAAVDFGGSFTSGFLGIVELIEKRDGWIS